MSVELLAPAGNFEKLETALHFGADAVYLSGKNWGMRARAANFDLPELRTAVQRVHEAGKKVYVTLNIFAHNVDFEGLDTYVEFLADIKVDGVIVADYGIFRLVRNQCPQLPIHISTQANVTNAQAAKFWEELGASRITLARELSLDEIRAIRDSVSISLEVFAHGAMCMAYSGRCLLSNYLTGRDSNKGDCAHVCRWEYKLVEARKESNEIIAMEDERGTYLFNSKDMATISILDQLIETGVDSLKIEGRMKSVNYVSKVVSVYRNAIDELQVNRVLTKAKKMEFLAELEKTSNREFFTGFYEKKPDSNSHNYESSQYKTTSTMVGVVKEVKKSEYVAIEARQNFSGNEKLFLLKPNGTETEVVIKNIRNLSGNRIESAKPNQLVMVNYDKRLELNGILIRPKGE